MKNKARVYHRYLGFFLAGVMAVYAVSGMLMIFRTTDFLKSEKTIERKLAPGLDAGKLAEALRIRDLRATGETPEMITFPDGSYDKATGMARYKSKELPVVLQKMEQMHKATTNSPMFYLNLFFGASLLFFVASSFFMFTPGSTIFRKGIYFAASGLVLALIVVLL